MWRIEFSTDKFTPYLPEEAQQNPGAYGFELADWLARSLAQQGLITSYPVGEDWGWFIEYLQGETEVMIGCGSEAKEGDGYNGKPISWRVFVRQPKSLKQRFKGVPESSKVTELAVAVEKVLQQAGIHVRRTEA
jgi:hypothetical protein